MQLIAGEDCLAELGVEGQFLDHATLVAFYFELFLVYEDKVHNTIATCRFQERRILIQNDKDASATLADDELAGL